MDESCNTNREVDETNKTEEKVDEVDETDAAEFVSPSRHKWIYPLLETIDSISPSSFTTFVWKVPRSHILTTLTNDKS